METYLAYFDETGDDGLIKYSSDHFVFTSLYMPSSKWQENYDALRLMRRGLRDDFGLHVTEEFHTKQFLTDKNPYRAYSWTSEQKQEILKRYTITLASLDMQCMNVVVDKTKVKSNTYSVLENALTYSVQRIENDSAGRWKYIILSDKGRVSVMSHTARKIRAFNPVPSMFGFDYRNQPIKNMVEDILEKDSKESYFIQSADFISYFSHLYFLTHDKNLSLPNRVANLIDRSFVDSVLATLKKGEKINLKASRSSHPYGFVIYPK